MTSDLRRARRAFLLVGVLVPVVLSVVALVVVLGLLPLVPDPAATHWGTSGADGFATPWAYVWMLLGVGLALPVVLSLSVLASSRDSWGVTGRFLGAVAAGLSAFFAVAFPGSLWIQRGLSDAADAPDVLPVVGVAFGGALVAGAGAWFAQPAVQVLPSLDDGAETVRPIALRSGDRVAWVGTATVGRVGVIMLAFTLGVLVVTAVALLLAGVGAWWPVAVTAVLIALAMAATLTFRVRVGPGGFVLRSVLGWPGVSLPLARIADARAVHISPLAEFGGWGWRIGLDGRRGAVLRAGEALQVTADDGRVYVATVEGAGDAAAVLAALIGRTAERGDAERSREE